MRYSESRESSAELLRLTLPLMAQQKSGFHPVSFTLWYEHLAGINPELSRELTRRLDAQSPLTDDDTYDLHARHVVARDMHTLRELQERLRKLLEEAFQITAQASDQTGQFERSLEATQHRLTAPTSLDGVRAVVSELLSESQRMQVLTQAVVEKLDVRAQEVGELRTALERAQTEALLDPLTGLKNRRAFERAVSELMREEPGMAGAALLLVDIDHFKGVNDTYGHLFGDKVLRAVAHVLQANIKGRDLVARLGGEEFGILFVKASADGALAVAEQIRGAVSQGRIRSVAGPELTGAVTVSAGLAVATTDESLESLLERADGALYEAKRTGRNRVCVASAATVRAPR
jgi:diguanylate cyclase